MDETRTPEDAALSHSDSGPLGRVRDPGGLESEGLTLYLTRSGSILRGRTPHPSQMSDSQALTEFDMVTVQGQTGLSASGRETVTSYTVSAAAADLSPSSRSRIKVVSIIALHSTLNISQTVSDRSF